MKKSLKVLFSIFLLFSSSSLVAGIIISNVSHSSSLNSNYQINGTNNQKLDNVTETVTTYSYKTPTTISWYGTKNANEVTNNDLLELVVPANPQANYYIEKIPVNSFCNLNGYVEFNVYQVLREFVNGVSEGTVTIQKINPTGTQIASSKDSSVTDGSIWITPDNLVKSQKYTFAWRTDSEIGAYFKNSTVTSSTLTAQDVLLNLVVQDSNHLLPSGITIAVTDLPGVPNSGSLYGVSQLVLTLPTTTTTDWVSGSVPTTTDLTKIIRGLNTASGTKNEMTFVTNYDSTTIKNIPLDPATKSIFGNVLLPSENSLGDLTPSELTNVGSNSKALIDLFVNGKYLSIPSGSKKIIDLQYMGMSFKDTNFLTNTGIGVSLGSAIDVTNILSYPNDLDGSLQLVYEYSYFDVWSNSLMTGSTIQNFAAGTFKTNTDSNKTLTFSSWKNKAYVDTLFTNSYDLVNTFNSELQAIPSTDSQTRQNYATSFSNLFFTGSQAAYEKKDRTVTIDYEGGHNVDANGKWVPKVANTTNVVIKIVFQSWNGNIYVDPDTSTEYEGLLKQNTYNLNTYSTSSTINWSNNTSTSIDSIRNLIPSDVAYNISLGTIASSTFFSSPLPLSSTIFTPFDDLGSLCISVFTNDGNIHTNIFTNFSTFQSSGQILNFSWIPQVSIPQTLLSKSVNDVTDQEIFDLIKANNPFMQNNSSITISNMTLVRNATTNSIDVTINIPFFDQSSANPVNQNFKTILSGFTSVSSNQQGSYTPPIDISYLIGGIIGGIIAAILLCVLIYQVIKIYRLKNAKRMD